MSNPVIEIKNLSKVYHISHERRSMKGTATLRDSLSELIHKPIELVTGRQLKKEEFWALKNINLDIEQGDIIGIIGKNGSGKSTLLKILSQIVEPTTGEIHMHGKVASLLEVGTGFHPELTGRENVFFNGAILGMKRKEIMDKFDEIVAFSEVEQFLDTPVKYYSSGMYVRLAFAVAAHLEPDILIVDEVLAVGDAAFQKKCIRKIKSIAESGKTVLFVSHSTSTVMSLCNKSIWINKGTLLEYGNTEDVVRAYLNENTPSASGEFERPNDDTGILRSATLSNANGRVSASFKYGDKLVLSLKTRKEKSVEFGIEVRLKSSSQELVCYASSWINSHKAYLAGEQIIVHFPSLRLVDDTYYLDIIARMPHQVHVDNWWDAISFKMTGAKPGKSKFIISSNDQLGSVVLEETEFNNA